MNLKLQYDLDEKPPFAFCESIHAGPLAPWHIRPITPSVGLKLGGGIDTKSLCGRVERGWDLSVRMAVHHFNTVTHGRASLCKTCRDVHLASFFEAMLDKELPLEGRQRTDQRFRDDAWRLVETGQAPAALAAFQNWLDGSCRSHE